MRVDREGTGGDVRNQSESGEDLMNRYDGLALVRTRLCDRFRGLPRESMILQMKENEWNGDYNEYSNAFSDIVTNGEDVPKQDLVLYFLAGLPEEIGDELTNRGKREFSTWNEAADALREYIVPLNSWRAKRKRTVREM
ncbi:uncharacterized protein EMH_0000070 [Eimeria mitis]|uniref:Retrotransposon gag domain-containing protein n=1 Tax=Eimeria mitis TaxID=44415 RepID=U6KHM4_9EIME|nr:uncharacterized protein EMH_0000070 [Eimeria mitis]CDJ35772.1 hypothetical protein EMH_0000070 [Eimeria mitis]